MAVMILTDDDLRAEYIRNVSRGAREIESAMLADTDECINWPYAKDKYGYGKLSIRGYKNGVFGGYEMRAHRYCCARAHGNPTSDDLCAAHSCNNPSCVNPRHLSWKTHAENMKDKIPAGTNTAGEANASAKLTANDVRQIRAMAQSMTKTSIAKSFGVSITQVRRIINRTSWASI